MQLHDGSLFESCADICLAIGYNLFSNLKKLGKVEIFTSLLLSSTNYRHDEIDLDQFSMPYGL